MDLNFEFIEQEVENEVEFTCKLDEGEQISTLKWWNKPYVRAGFVTET